MIKIFNANDREFSSNGNIIIEPTKCIEIKKKSLNGWYIEVEIPIKYKKYIEKDKLCVVQTKSKLNPQAFRIAENIEYTSRKIKFTANHVMFDSKDYILVDVRPTKQNANNALNYINQRADNVSPFVMFSDVENVNTAYFIRKNLLEAWTIIEERWGGSFDADNWDISFLKSVGNDNGESIVYGKNLQSVDIYEDWTNVVTKIYPVGYDGIMLPEQFLESDIQYEKPYSKVIDFETEIEFEEQTQEKLVEELRENAQKYLDENKFPKISYTIVSNINEKMGIGDTVHLLHPLADIKTEVLEYQYNIISKKIKSLTFGNYAKDVKTKFENIKNSINKITQTLSKQESVINGQTNLINTLNKNGYVYIDDNEIMILDKIPKEKAQNVWRFGLGGIGFSSNGYEGPFETAITMDGQINAKFITTGTMSVSRIEGLADELTGIISAIELNNENIVARVEKQEEKIEKVQEQADSNTDEIAKLGSTDTIEGQDLTVNASNNPAKLYIYGNTVNGTDVGENGNINITIESNGQAKEIIFPLSEGQVLCKGDYLAEDGIHKGNDVIPYTPQQQEVLDSIETFKGSNHIYCTDTIKPEKMVLTYYPNTPYNDTLVSKDTFDKVTTDMNAEFNIRTNEVETNVKEATTASILTLLNNGYLTAEQVNALVNGNAEDIATVKEQLKQTVTSSQMQIEITKAIEGGVSYLKNTLFTIDENGMAIATSEDEFNALYNNKGMYLYSYDEMIAKFDVDGATITGNLTLEGELITPNLRMINVVVDGVPHTHIHWIGG